MAFEASGMAGIAGMSNRYWRSGSEATSLDIDEATPVAISGQAGKRHQCTREQGRSI